MNTANGVRKKNERNMSHMDICMKYKNEGHILYQ